MDKPFLDKLRKIDRMCGRAAENRQYHQAERQREPVPACSGVTEILRTFDTAKLAIYRMRTRKHSKPLSQSGLTAAVAGIPRQRLG